jgi:hypothetical protein
MPIVSGLSALGPSPDPALERNPVPQARQRSILSSIADRRAAHCGQLFEIAGAPASVAGTLGSAAGERCSDRGWPAYKKSSSFNPAVSCAAPIQPGAAKVAPASGCHAVFSVPAGRKSFDAIFTSAKYRCAPHGARSTHGKGRLGGGGKVPWITLILDGSPAQAALKAHGT